MTMLEVWFLFTFIPNLKEGSILIGLDFLTFVAFTFGGIGYIGLKVLSAFEDIPKDCLLGILSLQTLAKKLFVVGVSVSVLISLIEVCLPSGKQLAAIYLIPYTTNTLQEYQIPDKLFKALEQELDKWIEEDIISTDENSTNI